jgi:hypothetical protein
VSPTHRDNVIEVRRANLLSRFCPSRRPTFDAEREAYYGDLDLHTRYSFDAYRWALTRVDPDEAYRHESVTRPAGID